MCVLDRIVARGGVVSAVDQSLIRYLREHSRNGATVGEALGEIRAWVGDRSRTLAIDLAVAQSEVMRPGAARRMLVDVAETYGATSAVVTRLLASYDDPSGMVGQAARLLEVAPLEGEEIALRLFRLADQAALEDAIERDSGALLLEGWYRLALFDPAGALDSLAQLSDAERRGVGARLLAVRAFTLDGRFDDANLEIDSLLNEGTVDARRGAVRALFDMQRYTEASTIATELAERADASSLDLVNAARLALNAGDETRAAAWLTRALELDPHDESSREVLITLALESTPPDEALATGNMRAIRELRPEGRLVRWVTATQMLQRGFQARAQPILMSLLEEEPGDQRAFDAIMGVWVARAGEGESEESLAWLGEQILRRPLDHWLVAGRARVLAAAGLAEQAERELAAAHEIAPAPILAMHRELIMRELLGRGDEADALAMQRLEAGPRGIDAAVEIVVRLIERDRLGAARLALEDHTPASFELTREQSSKVANAIRNGLDELTPLRPTLDLFAGIGARCRPISGELTLLWLAVVRQPVGGVPAGMVDDGVALIEASGEPGAMNVLRALRRESAGRRSDPEREGRACLRAGRRVPRPGAGRRARALPAGPSE